MSSFFYFGAQRIVFFFIMIEIGGNQKENIPSKVTIEKFRGGKFL